MRKFLCALVFSVALLFGCGGSNTAQTPPPADLPTISISASPNPINQGESTTITWTTTNATSVEISGIPEATSPSGVVTVTPAVTTVYEITAHGVQAVSAQVVVTVITVIVPSPPPPPPPPVITVYITARWEMPTTYTDGTPLDPTTVSVLLFMKSTPDPFTDLDLPIAEALPGATSVDFGPVDVNRGATYYFSCKAKTSTGEISVFSPVIVYIWN
jgi:hypothetical protein